MTIQMGERLFLRLGCITMLLLRLRAANEAVKRIWQRSTMSGVLSPGHDFLVAPLC